MTMFLSQAEACITCFVQSQNQWMLEYCSCEQPLKTFLKEPSECLIIFETRIAPYTFVETSKQPKKVKKAKE